MDNGDGTFRKLTEEEAESLKKPMLNELEKQVENIRKLEEEPDKMNEERRIFKEGEVLEIKQSRFRVHKIQKNKLILKLLPSKKEYY